MKTYSILDYIALILVVVGGLNWGLVGLFDFNLVSVLLGEGSILTRFVYGLVGLSAIYTIVYLTKCSSCSK